MSEVIRPWDDDKLTSLDELKGLIAQRDARESSVPKEVPASEDETDFNPNDYFLLNYNIHWCRSLIELSNCDFEGTLAEIPIEDDSRGVVKGLNIFQRAAVIETLRKDKEKSGFNGLAYPVTPEEIEELYLAGKYPSGVKENLALVSYTGGGEDREKFARALAHDIDKYNLTVEELERPLLIVNPCLDLVEGNVKFRAHLGTTEVYPFPRSHTGVSESKWLFQNVSFHGVPCLGDVFKIVAPNRSLRTMSVPSLDARTKYRFFVLNRLDNGDLSVNLDYNSMPADYVITFKRTKSE